MEWEKDLGKAVNNVYTAILGYKLFFIAPECQGIAWFCLVEMKLGVSGQNYTCCSILKLSMNIYSLKVLI